METPSAGQTTIERRKLILGLAAFGLAAEEITIGGIRESIFAETADKPAPHEPGKTASAPPKTDQPENAARPFELTQEVQSKLAPYVQPTIKIEDPLDSYNRLSSEALRLYPIARSPEAVSNHLDRMLENSGGPFREGTQWFVENLEAIGFLDQLKMLQERNREKGSKAKLALIPQVHPQDPSYGGENELNTLYREQLDASARNIAGILEVLREFEPKIFVEGNLSEMPVDEETELRVTAQLSGGNTAEIERLKREIAEVKKTQPWLYDGRFDVYGLECSVLRSLQYKYTALCENTRRCHPAHINELFILFSMLMREQFAIEHSLKHLSDDQLGVIVIGAAHIPTMKQYLTEKHPEVDVNMIIPRFSN